MIKVCYLVDGFNLYHSVSDASLDLQATTKWLNIKKLCESYLPSQVGKGAVLKDIYYFSAYTQNELVKWMAKSIHQNYRLPPL